MALSKSVNYFVNTIYYDPITIGALNTNDSEAIQSTLPIVLRRYVFSLRSPLKERSAEHDVAGITARIDTTFENSGTISNRRFACRVSMTSAAVFNDFGSR